MLFVPSQISYKTILVSDERLMRVNAHPTKPSAI